jgi:F-box-like
MIIQDLPQELVLEIFKYLDAKTLKTAALVCKQ